jgi:iron complex outermembrane recepter protein
MKNIFLLLILLLCSFYIKAQSLSGTITDSATHQTIPGAAVYFPELKVGSTTDVKGNYKITQIPNGRYLVEVEILGYATITKQITLKGDVIQNFAMAVSSSSEKEVVITALGNVTNTQRSPTPVSIITHDMLIQTTATNAVDAIALQPGITAITTGPGVSKPEVDGLGYNRVLTLFDGERQEDFQWGDEHGILIDPYSVYDVEIIRGAASLQYGANAVAGVVSFKSEPFPEAGTIQGSVLSEYQTNNGMIGNSFDISGASNNGFVWSLRASYEEAHDYSDPKDGYVLQTAYNQSNVRGMVGLNKKWGYTRLSVSMLHRQVEIPDGNRDSATGQFAFDNPQSTGYGNPQYYSAKTVPNHDTALVGTLVPGTGKVLPTRSDFLSYNPDVSVYQVLEHDEVWWQNSINVGLGRIGADVGFTQSHREEVDSGAVPAEQMTVHDIPYSLKYQVAGENSGLKFTTGVNGIYEFESNASEPPPPYIGDFEIPNYTDFDIGGYAILNEDFKNLTLSGGVRYDLRTINGQSMYLGDINTSSQTVVPEGTPGATLQFPGFNRSYTGLSASFGGTYQLPGNNYIKLNFAKSYRAPSISELTSNELDPSNIYRQGDPNLKAEDGYEGDIAYGNNGRDISFEMDGFANYINNFIFDDRISNYNGTSDSIHNGAPVYKYQAFDAIIAGATAYFNIHPADTKWIEVNNGFTYNYSYFLHQGNSDSTLHVPWTPAARLTSQVRFKLKERHTSFLSATYITIGLAHYWAQTNIYSALWNELPSVAYTLYNAGVGTNFVNRKTGRVVCTFIINCTNLMNLAYTDHTSREQYFWAYNGASSAASIAAANSSALSSTNYGKGSAVVTIPTEGIYNMGRNIGFKLLFPIGGHKVSDTEMKGATE